MTLRTFFKSGTTPASAVLDPSTRRSSRNLDATNMESVTVMSKWARVARKKVVESEATHAFDGGGGDMDVDMGDSVIAEDTYRSTKVMGD